MLIALFVVVIQHSQAVLSEKKYSGFAIRTSFESVVVVK